MNPEKFFSLPEVPQYDELIISEVNEIGRGDFREYLDALYADIYGTKVYYLFEQMSRLVEPVDPVSWREMLTLHTLLHFSMELCWVCASPAKY
jgi:hypothetical protein